MLVADLCQFFREDIVYLGGIAFEPSRVEDWYQDLVLCTIGLTFSSGERVVIYLDTTEQLRDTWAYFTWLMLQMENFNDATNA